jgi:hypothetical protein
MQLPPSERDYVVGFQTCAHQTGRRMPDAEQVTDLVRHDCSDEVGVPRHSEQRVGAGSSASRQLKCDVGHAGDRDDHRSRPVVYAVSRNTTVFAAVRPIMGQKDYDDLRHWPVLDRTRS